MMLETKKTVRELSNVFGVSKSTVHKDLKYRLIRLDHELYQKVEKILKFHKEVRHLRGGESTKKKYLNLEI
ncbi:MAG TPA: sporulation transcriptional regulator SpoIIID [Candidatus Pelethosoma merdigallinarum]|nr:sporulation transcriptional regulator SpoIIID [Candidatus Pelethosoma merdigallinarum]